MNPGKAVILIPAYQPDAGFIDLLKEIKSKTESDIVVVNDGSTPDRAPSFQQAAEYATVLTHAVNQGKGRALKTGLEYIKAHYDEKDIVITMDADGQHKIDDALRVGQAAAEQSDTLVTGSRAFVGKVPLRSRLGNTLTRWVYKLVTGTSLHDTQTGLRAFSASMIPFMMDIKGDRYEYEMNVLLTCSRNGVTIREIPIKTVYIQGNASSHFDALWDSIRIYKDIFKFALSSFAGFLIDFIIFSLMILVTKGLPSSTSIMVSNVTARVVSASANYSINKRFVFKNKDSIIKTAAQYFLLAAAILLINTTLLTVLVESILPNKIIGKLFVEIVLFTVSWLVQRFIIFKKSMERVPK